MIPIAPSVDVVMVGAIGVPEPARLAVAALARCGTDPAGDYGW